MDREDCYWDNVAAAMSRRYHLDSVMADHKRRVHLELLRSWCGASPTGRILKTDLFEEAFGDDEVLSKWPDPPGRSPPAVGIDISGRICGRARNRLHGMGRTVMAVAGDARRLPFPDGTFDVVFSCSTLDHFLRREDLDAGLREAARVLSRTGRLVLVLDNPRALLHGVVRWFGAKGILPFRLGETLEPNELEATAEELGLEVIEQRAVYHVPRMIATSFFRVLRAVRFGFADRFLLGRLAAREERSGRPGEYRTGWYTAACLVKAKGPYAKGMKR